MSRADESEARPGSFRVDGATTLIGAGPASDSDVAFALSLAPHAIAVDGGADVSLPEGFGFEAVVGDLDSLSKAQQLRSSGVPVLHIAEQDTTDLEKCLYTVEAPLMLGVGFLGGRIDHELSALAALVRYAHKAVVLLGAQDVVFAAEGQVSLDLPGGTRVSIFPMRGVRGIGSEGLRWPLDDLELSPDGRLGTSNEAIGGPVRFEFDRTGALVILPRDALREAIAARSRP